MQAFYFSNVDCEAIRAPIALKHGRLLSFMIRNASVGKIPIEGGFH